MKKQSGTLSQNEIITQVRELSALETGLKWATNPRVLLEVTLIKLCGSSSPANESIADRLTAIENRLSSSDFIDGARSVNQAASGVNTQTRYNGNTSNIAAGNTTATTSAGTPFDILSDAAPAAGAYSGSKTSASQATSTAIGSASGSASQAPSAKIEEFQQWPKIMDHLKRMGKMKIHSFLLNAKAIQMDENNIGLLFSVKENFTKTLVSKLEHIELIEEAILKITGREMKVKCLDEEAFNKTPVKAKRTEKDELVEKARSFADKAGLPLEILDE